MIFQPFDEPLEDHTFTFTEPSVHFLYSQFLHRLPETRDGLAAAPDDPRFPFPDEARLILRSDHPQTFPLVDFTRNPALFSQPYEVCAAIKTYADVLLNQQVNDWVLLMHAYVSDLQRRAAADRLPANRDALLGLPKPPTARHLEKAFGTPLELFFYEGPDFAMHQLPDGATRLSMTFPRHHIRLSALPSPPPPMPDDPDKPFRGQPIPAPTGGHARIHDVTIVDAKPYTLTLLWPADRAYLKAPDIPDPDHAHLESRVMDEELRTFARTYANLDVPVTADDFHAMAETPDDPNHEIARTILTIQPTTSLWPIDDYLRRVDTATLSDHQAAQLEVYAHARALHKLCRWLTTLDLVIVSTAARLGSDGLPRSRDALLEQLVPENHDDVRAVLANAPDFFIEVSPKGVVTLLTKPAAGVTDPMHGTFNLLRGRRRPYAYYTFAVAWHPDDLDLRARQAHRPRP